MRTLRIFLLVVMSMLPIASFGQTPSSNKPGDDLIGSWLVSVEGEARNRTLRITSVGTKSEGSFLLEAVYGWTDGKQTSVKAEMNQLAQERKLLVTTQPGTKIVTTQGANGKFSGTFTLTSGVTKNVTIAKVSEEELQSIQKSVNKSIPDIQKPDADVPVQCAAFIGGWTGIWPSIGRVWMWIVAVDTKCTARYSYGISAAVPKTFRTAEIQNGVLAIPRPNGTTSFEIQGAELFGQYSGSDGSNSATMQKIQTSDDSVAKLRAEQNATENFTPIPPGGEIPKMCADFFGSWLGGWSRGGFDEQRLRVVEVNAKCVAKYSYGIAKTPNKIFETSEIKDGVLSFVCNKSTGGTCDFRRSGDGLSADYSNPSGGTNSGAFKKTP